MTEEREKVQAITRATERGHVMRNVDETEPVAPGVFAECVECKATLRYYHGSLRGEGSLSWCPEAPPQPQVAPEPTPSAELEPDARLAAYETYTLTDWATTINQWASDKGWNDKPLQLDGLIALMHSELSEALEEWRDGHAEGAVRFEVDKYGNQKPEGVPIELMDCVIRILHTLAYYGVDANHIMQTKHEYNVTRPYRHGGKRT